MLLACVGVKADLYKYVDPEGRVVFTNVPIGGGAWRPSSAAKQASTPFKQEATGARSSATSAAKLLAVPSMGVNVTPSGFPRVDSATQRRRDETRKRILEDELHAEESLLDGATAKRDIDEMHVHGQNISALKRELAAIKP
jgi:hypothetical protein